VVVVLEGAALQVAAQLQLLEVAVAVHSQHLLPALFSFMEPLAAGLRRYTASHLLQQVDFWKEAAVALLHNQPLLLLVGKQPLTDRKS
jgi:hypothetical protein